MDLESIKRDVKTVEEGTWVTDIPNCEGLRLLVRGMSNRKYKAAIARMARTTPRKDRDQFGTLKQEVMQLIIGKALHEACLLDWDGLTQGGQPQLYDKKLALTLLTTPEFEPFAEAVQTAASMVDNMLADGLDDAAKNSPTPSEPEPAATTTSPT